MSRLAGELDPDLAAFRERNLAEIRYPSVWLDAQYEKVRDGLPRRDRRQRAWRAVGARPRRRSGRIGGSLDRLPAQIPTPTAPRCGPTLPKGRPAGMVPHGGLARDRIGRGMCRPVFVSPVTRVRGQARPLRATGLLGVGALAPSRGKEEA